MKSINSDIAYDFLRKRILNGEYLPGQALMSNMLASEIGVSRTPIRDALRQLETDGLVTIEPRLGASVKKMDVKSFRESCELRLALESHAAALASRNRSELDLHEINLALQAMSQITKELVAGGTASKLIAQLIREDVRFHLAIISAAKNDLMQKEIIRLHLVNRVVSTPSAGERDAGRSDKERDLNHRREVLKCHERIARAIAAGEAETARKEMQTHIQDIIDRSVQQHARAIAAAPLRELSAAETIYRTSDRISATWE